jgi:hypothetical protein
MLNIANRNSSGSGRSRFAADSSPFSTNNTTSRPVIAAAAAARYNPVQSPRNNSREVEAALNSSGGILSSDYRRLNKSYDNLSSPLNSPSRIPTSSTTRERSNLFADTKPKKDDDFHGNLFGKQVTLNRTTSKRNRSDGLGAIWNPNSLHRDSKLSNYDLEDNYMERNGLRRDNQRGGFDSRFDDDYKYHDDNYDYGHNSRNRNNEERIARPVIDDDKSIIVNNEPIKRVDKSYLQHMKPKYKYRLSANVSGTKFEIGKQKIELKFSFVFQDYF